MTLVNLTHHFSLGVESFPAILTASLAAFVLGAVWFGPKTFYPVWIKAQGRELPPERITMSRGQTATLFGGTFVGVLVQVTTLDLIIGFSRAAGSTFNVQTGALLGLVFSVGLSGFASLSHRMFGQYNHNVYWSLKVWLIEITQDALGLAVAGAILGAWL